VPIATASNAYSVGIDKQTNESTVSATADYAIAATEVPDLNPVEALNRIEVLDGTSIQGDPYKGPQSWAGSFTAPAYGDSLGRLLQALWPTDTTTGAGPYTHTYSGLGGTQSWIALYSEWTNASAFEQTFGKGQCSGITFSATNDGSPLTVGFSAVGQETTVATWTATATDNLDDGYFRLVETGGKIELDVDTPNVNPSTQPEKIQNFTLSVNRDITPEPVVDAFQVSTLGQGKVTFSGSMDWLWTSWDAYRATYFGAVAGTAASPTLVKGALELTCKHSSQGTWEFRIYIPSVSFRVGSVAPNADGSPLRLPVTMEIAKPTTGDHVQPILINSTSTSY
jgi:hypothetical protein